MSIVLTITAITAQDKHIIVTVSRSDDESLENIKIDSSVYLLGKLTLDTIASIVSAKAKELNSALEIVKVFAEIVGKKFDGSEEQ